MSIEHPKLVEEAIASTQTPRRSRRVRKPTKLHQPGLDYVYYMDTMEPFTYKEAIVVLDAETRHKAMKSKMDSIKEILSPIVKMTTHRLLLGVLTIEDQDLE